MNGHGLIESLCGLIFRRAGDVSPVIIHQHRDQGIDIPRSLKTSVLNA